MNKTLFCNATLILLTNIINEAKQSDVHRFESLKRDCMGKSSCDPSRICQIWKSHSLTVHYMCVDKTYVRSSSCKYDETVTDTFGYIQSPGYPGGSPIESSCRWIIDAPVDKAVVILLHDLVTKNGPEKRKTILEVSGTPCEGDARDSTYFYGNDNTTSVTRCGRTDISFRSSHKANEVRFWLSFCVLHRDHISTFTRSTLHCPTVGHDVNYGQGSKDLLGANSQDSNTEVLVIMLSIISGISAVLLIILIVICVRCRLIQASGAESGHSDPSPSVQPHYEYPSTSDVEKPRPRLADGYFEVSDALPFVQRLEPPTSPTYAEVEHTVGIKKVFHIVPSEEYLRGPKSKARPGEGNKKNNQNNQRHKCSASSGVSQTETSGDLDAHKGDNNTRTYTNTTRNVEVQTMFDCMEKETISKNISASSETVLNKQTNSESDGCSIYETIGKAPAVKTCMQANKRNQTDSRRLSSDVHERNVPTIESCSKNLQDVSDKDKPNSTVGCEGLSATHCPFTTDHTYFVLEKRNKSAYLNKSEPTDMRARSKSLPGRNHDIKKQHKRTAFKDIASGSGIVRNGIMKFELNST